jgi:NhaA family Na+:H+ antiporter
MRRPTLDYLKTESGAGLLLVGAAVTSLALANSSHRHAYFALAAMHIPLRVGAFAVDLSLADWVREGLMPLFFLVLGMQLKFELLRGELSNLRGLAAPALAALGGLLAPAAAYLLIAGRGQPAMAGLMIGGATDTALALAVLGLAAPRSPSSLRVLLIAAALADNVVSVALTAFLAASRIRWPLLFGAAVVLAMLVVLGRWRRAPFLFYAAGFVLVWAFVLKSGLDTALAGIACAATAPMGARRPGHDSTLKYFMDSLHPYVAYAVLPLYVLTAAGISAADLQGGLASGRAPLAALLSMWLAKPAGVFGFCALAVALRIGRRPSGALWGEVLGVALLCGAGLTVSLFVAQMSPVGGSPEVRLAAIAGSALAALSGGVALKLAQGRRLRPTAPPAWASSRGPP